MSEAIRTKYSIVTRRDRRPADKEVKKAWAVIEQVEFDFENAIFYAPKYMSYKDIYDYYLKYGKMLLKSSLQVNH